MKIYQFIKNKFKRRSLYIICYLYCDELDLTKQGEGNFNFESYQKINSFEKISFIKEQIKKLGFNNQGNITIIITNIIKLY